MKTHSTIAGRLALVMILLSGLLAACGPAAVATPTPAPTQDPATLVAQAVLTVSAQYTADAIAHPSPTPVPPTATLTPTITPIPPTATPALPTATFTATATTQPPLSAQPLYVTTFPENRREYIPNERFSVALGFLNNGTIAWDSGTKVKLVGFKGEITVNPEVVTDKRTAPGEKIEFDFWAFGSETLGQHIWYFQLYNSQGLPIPGGYTSFTYTSH